MKKLILTIVCLVLGISAFACPRCYGPRGWYGPHYYYRPYWRSYSYPVYSPIYYYYPQTPQVYYYSAPVYPQPVRVIYYY